MAKRRSKTRRPKGFGSFWQDEAGRWLGRVTYQGVRINVADSDRAGAEAKLEARKREIDKRINRDGAKMTLGEFLLWWLGEVVKHEVKESTFANYQRRVEIYILPNSIASRRLSEILPRDVRTWMNAMRGRFARSSIRQARSLLERALEVAVSEKYIDDNPAASVKPLRPAPDEDEEDIGMALTPEQVEKFLQTARTKPMTKGKKRKPQVVSAWTDLSVLYLLAVRLGLRRGELLGLRWEDIDWEGRLLTITQQVIYLKGSLKTTSPKTKSGRRRLPLSDELLTALREHRVRTGRREGLIFATRDGGPISPRNLQRHFKAIVSRAELPGNLRLHDLRVTAVTRWREAGTDLEVAAALAGHSTPQVTAGTYSKATEERMRLAIERMG